MVKYILSALLISGFMADPADAQTLPHITEQPVFSHPGGFYDTPFTLTIQSPDPLLTIMYTIDGSNPVNSPTAMQGTASVTLPVDPTSATGRAVTPAFIVRAVLTGKVGYSASFTAGQTYIFTSKVITQHAPGGNWPAGNVNGQYIDYPMDSKVTGDLRYAGLIETSLKAIPSISVITDNKNLFDPDTGIYVNAERHGEDWERECSVELLNPDGTPGFSVNAGLRIRGGWSRNDDFPKHAFRLFFNAEYGNTKLKYPLFGSEGTDVFDKIDLKTAQNYSWANYNGAAAHNTFVRENFSRDLQGEMGQPYTRSRFYHLYLNGMYWGLYETQERSEANFASDYLGGKASDYDVVKVNMENFLYQIEATDGTIASWRDIWNLCTQGFASNANYFRLEGKDASGKHIPGATVMVDIDNLIDYMIGIFYTGNFDAPTSSFGQNKGCNNFYAIDNKAHRFRGFVFLNHDAEHAMMAEAIWPGVGLYEDRVSLATRTDEYRMEVGNFQYFHPQWLHYKLSANATYRMRFADRTYRYFQSGNLLSPEKCLERFNMRAATIDQAIIAESARWGDMGRSFAYTKDDAWVPELNEVRNDFIPWRSEIVLNQLIAAGLFPSLSPPLVKKDGSFIQAESFLFENSTQVSLEKSTANGSIYYTLDNSDPRTVSGGISATAIQYNAGAVIPISATMPLKCRTLLYSIWSPLNNINFLHAADDYTALKVTEIMYHPPDIVNGADTISDNSLEFIEFKNTGNSFLNLSGFILDSAVHCIFPQNTILGPGQFFVAASKPFSFSSFYEMEPSANFSDNFSNGGEYALLTDPAGNPVISFTYDDVSPWPEGADGTGNSLASTERDPLGDPNDPAYWIASSQSHGSPFTDDSPASADNDPWQYIAATVYPNPTADLLVVELNNAAPGAEAMLGIYDINGKLCYEAPLYGNTNLSLKEMGIPVGIYILRIAAGESILVKKIVFTPFAN